MGQASTIADDRLPADADKGVARPAAARRPSAAGGWICIDVAVELRDRSGAGTHRIDWGRALLLDLETMSELFLRATA